MTPNVFIPQTHPQQSSSSRITNYHTSSSYSILCFLTSIPWLTPKQCFSSCTGPPSLGANPAHKYYLPPTQLSTSFLKSLKYPHTAQETTFTLKPCTQTYVWGHVGSIHSWFNNWPIHLQPGSTCLQTHVCFLYHNLFVLPSDIEPLGLFESPFSLVSETLHFLFSSLLSDQSLWFVNCLLLVHNELNTGTETVYKLL